MTIGEKPTAPIGKAVEVWARIGQTPGDSVELNPERPTTPLSLADLEFWIEWLAGHHE